MKNLEIRHAMTPAPYQIDASEKLIAAKQLMHKHEIRHLPVVSDNHIVGVLSDRDIQVAISLASHVLDEGSILAGDVCTKDPYMVSPQESLDTVSLEMAKRHIGSAIIVENDLPVGIFTVTDACRTLGELLHDGLP